MQSIIQVISKEPGSEEINMIEQDELTILLDYGESIISVMIVRHRFRIHHEILSKIRNKFEENYGFLLNSCEFSCTDNSIFNGFVPILHNILYK